MPIKKCQINNKPGFKYGDEGTCYIYNPKDPVSQEKAYEKAKKQGQAIEISKIRNSSLKISFDVDGVLDTEKGKELAKQKINEGNSVYIITARQEKTMSKEVYDIAKEIGITKDKIFFTNGADKLETIKEKKINIHYDDSQEQIDKINKNTDTKGILWEK